MSFCPDCGLDFEEGMATCPECRVELVDIFPQADQRDPFRDFKTIFICYSMDDAVLVQSFLEKMNIPNLLSDLEMNSRGMRMGRDGQMRVFVPYDEMENAAGIIEEALIDGELQSVTGELAV